MGVSNFDQVNADIVANDGTIVFNKTTKALAAISVYNIKSYGAVGNGIANDTTAIQNAINAAVSGGTVYFPDGTYLINSDLTIVSNNVRLVGSGRSSIIKSANASSANCIKVSNANHIIISDLQLDGNRLNQSGGVSYSVNAGIRISQCDDVLVENIYVHDTYSQGIYAENSTNLIINKNRVHNTGDGGIFLHPQVNNPACTNVVISNNVVDMAGYYGITAIRSDYVTITGNDSYNNGQTDPSQGFGIDLEGSRYSIISNNLCHDGHGGILCRITTEGGANQNCNRNTIQGNTCYNNTPAGTHGEASIQCTDSDYILIANNFCSTAPQGINLGNATFVTVIGNTVVSHTNTGIRAYNSSGSNLTILNNFVNANSNNGIQTAVPRTLIEGNHIKGNTNEGIEFLSGSSNSVARHNYILDNTDNGILIDGSGTSGIEINDNEFDNTASTQGRALYESAGGGPTAFVNNRVINQNNVDFSISNSASQITADRTKIATVTTGASYTAKQSDFVIIVNKGTGSATSISLPIGVLGMELIIKDGKGDAATNNITITGTIDGAASVVINTNFGKLHLYFNGTQFNSI